MKALFLLCPIALFLTTCSQPKHYSSPRLFDSAQEGFSHLGEPNSIAYQNAARNQLRKASPSDYHYSFENYVEEGNSLYMMTNFKNARTCFSVKILLSKGDKSAGIKRMNSRSISEALQSLKWKLINVNGKEEVVFVD